MIHSVNAAKHWTPNMTQCITSCCISNWHFSSNKALDLDWEKKIMQICNAFAHNYMYCYVVISNQITVLPLHSMAPLTPMKKKTAFSYIIPSVTLLLLFFFVFILQWVRKDRKDKERQKMTKVVDPDLWLCSCMASCSLTRRASRMPLHYLCRFPNYITVQSISSYDRISVGTVVDDLWARGGVGKRDAMLPSLIYIEWKLINIPRTLRPAWASSFPLCLYLTRFLTPYGCIATINWRLRDRFRERYRESRDTKWHGWWLRWEWGREAAQTEAVKQRWVYFLLQTLPYCCIKWALNCEILQTAIQWPWCSTLLFLLFLFRIQIDESSCWFILQNQITIPTWPYRLPEKTLNTYYLMKLCFGLHIFTLKWSQRNYLQMSRLKRKVIMIQMTIHKTLNIDFLTVKWTQVAKDQSTACCNIK